MGSGYGLGLVLAGAAALAAKLLSPPPSAAATIEQQADEVLEEDQTGAYPHPQQQEQQQQQRSHQGPVTLEWDSISCVVVDKRGHPVKEVLKNVHGQAKAGRLLAIMGPSGSGKTTLLNVLAGQVGASPRLRLSGVLAVNGTTTAGDSAQHKVAYLRQEDLFFSQLTVRETLTLAAELQLPAAVSKRERARYVEDLLAQLGLLSCADTIVGDARARGISGGEKKRLSIACELIASPSVIFADEPTTGLDAFQAEMVMETLRRLAADDGHTVVCSIHQPRGSIYSKFHDLLLLSEGALVYTGPAQQDALLHFQRLGYACPPGDVNPAEFFADLISIDYSSADSEAVTRRCVTHLVRAFADTHSSRRPVLLTRLPAGHQKAAAGPVAAGTRPRPGYWRQFRLLLARAWAQTTRDGATNRVRGRMSVSSAIIFGSIFWRIGLSQTSIQDRMGLLQVAAINTAMAALTKTVNVFPKERTIVQRERAKGSYALAPYIAAKLVAEAPVSAAFPLAFGALLYPMSRLHPSLPRFGQFAGLVTLEAFAATAMGLAVGAVAPTTEAAMAIGPSLMTVFIVFGGYYVNSDNTPPIFRWIPQVSLIRWAFQGLCVNEFKGLTFEASKPFDLQNGDQVLERLSFGKTSVAQALQHEGRIALAWYWLTYVLLKRNRPRYQALEAPPPSS